MEHNAKVQAVIEVLKKYCNPKKEFDHISPTQVADEIIKAVEAPTTNVS